MIQSLRLLFCITLPAWSLRLQSIDNSQPCNTGDNPELPECDETILSSFKKKFEAEESLSSNTLMSINSSSACALCYNNPDDKVAGVCENIGCYGRATFLQFSTKDLDTYQYKYPAGSRRRAQFSSCSDQATDDITKFPRRWSMWFEGYVSNQLICNHCYAIRHTGIASPLKQGLWTRYIKFEPSWDGVKNLATVWHGGLGNNDKPDGGYKPCDPESSTIWKFYYKDSGDVPIDTTGGQQCQDVNRYYDPSRTSNSWGNSMKVTGVRVNRLPLPACKTR